MIKLEAGKRYVTRGGLIKGPLSYDPNPAVSNFIFSDEFGYTWREDGSYGVNREEHPADLVKEYVEPVKDGQPPLTNQEFQRQHMNGFRMLDRGTAPLSRRDQFAMAAMSSHFKDWANEGECHYPHVAENCVKMADALIAELDKEKEE